MRVLEIDEWNKALVFGNKPFRFLWIFDGSIYTTGERPKDLIVECCDFINIYDLSRVPDPEEDRDLILAEDVKKIRLSHRISVGNEETIKRAVKELRREHKFRVQTLVKEKEGIKYWAIK